MLNYAFSTRVVQVEVYISIYRGIVTYICQHFTYAVHLSLLSTF